MVVFLNALRNEERKSKNKISLMFRIYWPIQMEKNWRRQQPEARWMDLGTVEIDAMLGDLKNQVGRVHTAYMVAPSQL